jgi:glycosyltransferase involved in cell wall biosynthesis
MKVSILVITYNHEKYIKQALESVIMQQGVPDYEVILCDDNSTDKTVHIAAKLFAGFNNTSIHKNEKNLGITKNYQQAFGRCTGDYIFILEGDDYWTDPLKIKKLTNFMDANPLCVLCAHTFNALADNTGFLYPPVIIKEPVTFFNSEDLILDTAIISNYSTCCYRRKCLEKISSQTYETISYEWMINISIGQFGVMARINEPMSVYRISSAGTWSGKTPEEQLTGMIGIIDEYNKILEYKYANYFEKKKKLLSKELMTIKQPKKRFVNEKLLSALSSVSKLLSGTPAKH